MTLDEDQEAGKAGGPGRNGGQGRLSTEEGDRDTTRSPSSYRLKRSCQVLASADGALFLVRLGAGDDMRIEDPRPFDRALLELLSGERFVSLRELEARLDPLPPDEPGSSLRVLEAAGALEMTPYPRLLASRTAERVKRQLLYLSELSDPRTGPEPLQLELGRSSVLLVGCGGLGSWVAAGLCGAGVGRLILVDDDRVELSNLNRQILFAEADLGALKVDAAARALRARNNSVRVDPLVKRVSDLSEARELIGLRPDLVVLTADWPPYELPRWINQAAMEEGVPWIGAGQMPPRLRFGPLVIPGQSACLECLESQVRSDHPYYDELCEMRAEGGVPDASVGPITGVAGSLLASEAMHYLLGHADLATMNRALTFDVLTMRSEVHNISIATDCELCAVARPAEEARASPDRLEVNPHLTPKGVRDLNCYHRTR